MVNKAEVGVRKKRVDVLAARAATRHLLDVSVGLAVESLTSWDVPGMA